jgi:hypothetical protein
MTTPFIGGFGVVTGPPAGRSLLLRMCSESLGMRSICRATITMRTRVNQDENPVWGEAARA